MKIKEIASGATETITLLIKVIEGKTTRNGKPYACITATDGTDDVVGNFWDADAGQITEKYLGKVADVTINMGEYVTIKRLRLSEDQDISGFIRTAPISSDEMFAEIIHVLEGLKTPLKHVALELYLGHELKLIRWAGAEKMHHALYGGLLYHSYRMMQSAIRLSEVYPVVDRELLIVGAVLHDIGKLKELYTQDTGVAEYTVEGRLSGHLLLGVMMVHDTAAQINQRGEYIIPEESIRLLEHMVASHHGELDYGAITVPAIPEAILLHYIDMIDSRMYMVEDTLEGMEEGTMSDTVYALNRAHVYKPVRNPEPWPDAI